MKTRAKKMSDYGISNMRKKELLAYCYDSMDVSLIREAAVQANPAIAEWLLLSVTKKLSYDILICKYYIPIGKKDFYGYRRKMLAILDGLLKM